MLRYGTTTNILFPPTILLIAGMDVSRHILMLDISIFAKGNMDRREYTYFNVWFFLKTFHNFMKASYLIFLNEIILFHLSIFQAWNPTTKSRRKVGSPTGHTGLGLVNHLRTVHHNSLYNLITTTIISRNTKENTASKSSLGLQIPSRLSSFPKEFTLFLIFHQLPQYGNAHYLLVPF
jgi:hypothetical protein